MRTAHVVHVIGIAIVGRTQAHNGLQRRRLSRRHLQRIEAAPGDAHHADRAAAPGLAGDPCNGLHGISLFLRQVFIADEALGIARTSDIKAHAGIAVARKPGMDLFVPIA